MANMIELIKDLRERTGAGMMDCKKALQENDNDVEKACEWLREKGIAKAAKKSGRIAAEGMTYVAERGEEAIILEVNSETDFVSKSDAFKNLVKTTADILLKEKPGCIHCAKEKTESLFTDATVKIGEKLDLRRFELLQKEEKQVFGSYIHMGGKISVLMVFEGNVSKEDADNLAMHVAANAPLYISKEEISGEEKEKELAIQMEAAKQDPKLASKTEDMLKKILAGKVDKYFAESVLVEQEYLSEPGIKVGAWLKSHDARVLKMIRYVTGEGIQKREENFAEEVAKQMQ